jgi:Protein of unknown function (DUF3618)
VTEPFSTPRMVELEAEVAVARLQLASTVEAISQRLTPRALASDAGDRARLGVTQARTKAQQLVRDATSADADPEASTRARVILASAAAAAALVGAVALLRRRG